MRRSVAVGDPQAPLATFFAVLDRHGLRKGDRVAPDVRLVVMGDYFDWGTPAEAERAGTDALELLEWLASHGEDEVVLIVGNHDLGRVGELTTFDDETFARARKDALVIYGALADVAHVAFTRRWTELPTAEIAARDFSSFHTKQRDLVTKLLRAGRFHLAFAPADDLLMLHAGVTAPQLGQLGIDPNSGAKSIAAMLDQKLADAVKAWPGPPARLSIPGIHRPGHSTTGEGDGILYHRAAFEPKARRFDPRDLPRGLVQAIGHVRDKKSRELLGDAWTDGAPPEDGPLRHLVTDGTSVQYRRGLPDVVDPSKATMLFLDGGMNYVAPEKYEVFAIDSLRR
jgi:hypothetical protein